MVSVSFRAGEITNMGIRRWHLLIIAGCWSLIPISSPVLADFDAALVAYHKGNFTEAFKQLQPVETQGDPDAQLLLGFMYLDAEGVKRNLKTAAYWIQKSADQGHESAEYHLGLLYEHGKGVDRNISIAALSSSAGQAGRGGTRLLCGLGVKQDAARLEPQPCSF